MKKNEKVVMLIKCVDFGHEYFYECYDDVAYGYERYQELWNTEDMLSVEHVYVSERALEDYHKAWDADCKLNKDYLFDGAERMLKRAQNELGYLWNRLHK